MHHELTRRPPFPVDQPKVLEPTRHVGLFYLLSHHEPLLDQTSTADNSGSFTSSTFSMREPFLACSTVSVGKNDMPVSLDVYSSTASEVAACAVTAASWAVGGG